MMMPFDDHLIANAIDHMTFIVRSIARNIDHPLIRAVILTVSSRCSGEFDTAADRGVDAQRARRRFQNIGKGIGAGLVMNDMPVRYDPCSRLRWQNRYKRPQFARADPTGSHLHTSGLRNAVDRALSLKMGFVLVDAVGDIGRNDESEIDLLRSGAAPLELCRETEPGNRGRDYF